MSKGHFSPVKNTYKDLDQEPYDVEHEQSFYSSKESTSNF